MKKKVVSLLLVTTMVASLAAGCGDSSSSGDGTDKDRQEGRDRR